MGLSLSSSRNNRINLAGIYELTEFNSPSGCQSTHAQLLANVSTRYLDMLSKLNPKIHNKYSIFRSKSAPNHQASTSEQTFVIFMKYEYIYIYGSASIIAAPFISRLLRHRIKFVKCCMWFCIRRRLECSDA